MQIVEAQREMRTRFVGGAYGQLVSGLLWLVSAGLATGSGPRAGIAALVVGGFFIFSFTESLLRIVGRRRAVSAANSLRSLGMQVAFAVRAAVLVGGGVVIALYVPGSFGRGAWYTGAMLLLFAAVGHAIACRELRAA